MRNSCDHEHEECRLKIKLIVSEELKERKFLTEEQIEDIASKAVAQTMNLTFKLMGVRFKDNGEVDFEHVRENNDYITRLRRGHKQVTGIVLNSCIVTAVVAFLGMLGSSIIEHIRSLLR